MAALPEDPDVWPLALRPADCVSARCSLRLKLGGSEVLQRAAHMLEEPGIVPDCALTLDDLFPDLIPVQGVVR